MRNKNKYLYFKIAPERKEYKGIRFFKMNPLDFEIVQVVLHAGLEKKGRGHTLGIMTLSKITLYSNYLAMGYAIPCTKKEFDESFNKVVNLLSYE